MSKSRFTLSELFVVMGLVGALCAQVFADNHPESFNFQGDVNFDSGAIIKIKGVQLTASASDLNSGVLSGTSTVVNVSNATLKVYGKSLIITNDASLGTATVTNTLAVTGATTLTGNTTETGTMTINGTGGLLLGTNAVIVAGQWANRAALVVSTVTSNLPVGSVAVTGLGKMYQRVAAAAATSSWYTVTSANVE